MKHLHFPPKLRVYILIYLNVIPELFFEDHHSTSNIDQKGKKKEERVKI